MQKNEAISARYMLICSPIAGMLWTTQMAWAQDVTVSKTPSADAGKGGRGGVVVNKGDKTQATGGTISLHLEMMPVQEAFRFIAKQSGVQILVSTEAHGRIVDLSLSDVLVEVAIREVTRAAGLLSLKNTDNTYITVKPKVEPTLRSPIPSFILPPRVEPQKNVVGHSEYSLRMFEPSTSIDSKMIVRGNANYSSKFIVPLPPLNLDEKPSPRTFVLPRGGRIPLPQNRMLPIPNRGSRRYDLPKPPNLLKLPQLKPGPFSGLPFIIVPGAAPQQQPNVSQHR